MKEILLIPISTEDAYNDMMGRLGVFKLTENMQNKFLMELISEKFENKNYYTYTVMEIPIKDDIIIVEGHPIQVQLRIIGSDYVIIIYHDDNDVLANDLDKENEK